MSERDKSWIADKFEELTTIAPAERNLRLRQLACLDDTDPGNLRILEDYLRASDEGTLTPGRRTGRADILAALDQTPDPGQRIAPRVPTGPFEDEELINGRFRIERILGAGGMGVVYLARDEHLRENVALKVLRDDLRDDPEMQRRFVKEVKLARKISHRNVCRIHEIDSSPATATRPAISFFTMEYLEGRTLKERLEDGPLAIPDELPLLVQIAEGLAAAHRVGVIHRDIKPGNVMLTEDGPGPRAVITDFGLVRPHPESRGLLGETLDTGTNQLVGTRPYLAPEIFEGEPHTTASDVYSLGLVFYEALTGKRPFSDLDEEGARQRRSKEIPKNPRQTRSTIPNTFGCTVVQALHPDPTRRLYDAGQLGRRLQSKPDRFAIFRLNFSDLPRDHRLSRRHILGGLSIGIAGLSTLTYVLRQTMPSIAKSSKLLISRQTTSPTPELQVFHHLLTSSLRDSPYVVLPAAETIRSTLQAMRLDGGATHAPHFRELAWRLGIPTVAFSTVSTITDAYAITIVLESIGPAPTEPIYTINKTYIASDKDQFAEIANEAAKWIRDQIGESPDSVAKSSVLPPAVSTKSWQALLLYSRAEELSYSWNRQAALRTLDSALDFDPEFTLALMRKGDLQMALGDQQKGLADWKRAISLLSARPVMRREELRIRGMYAFDLGQLDVADRYFHTWADEYPLDVEPRLYRTLPLVQSGKAHTAIEELNEALRNEPNWPSLHGQLANCYIHTKNYAPAEKHIALMKKNGQGVRAQVKLAILQYCRGNFRDSHALFLAAASTEDETARALSRLHVCLFYLEMGLPQLVLALLAPVISNKTTRDELSTRLKYCVAYSYLSLNDQASAIDFAQSAWESDNGPTSLLHYGTILGRSGRLDQLKALLSHSQVDAENRLLQRVYHRLYADVHRLSGDMQGAKARIESALALEPPVATAAYITAYTDREPTNSTILRHLEAAVSYPMLYWIDPLADEPGLYRNALDLLSRSENPPPGVIDRVRASHALRQQLTAHDKSTSITAGQPAVRRS